MACPGENTLLECLEGRLARERRAGVEEHIDGCPDCYRIFAELARATSALGATPPAPSDPEPAHVGQELFAGDTVARYVIRRRVGAGGMGVVYEALDPALHRKLAVKLLHDGTATDEGRARLLREAKAMARLSHPNVVGVHDVGQAKGRIFIAMDFIEGTTLQGWLRAEPRGFRAVLDACLRAGRGLAAAHEAGLVHRDFKPGNVLVGDDGRICVTDFGLVRVAEGEAEPAAPAPRALFDQPVGAVTRTGALIGSPGYMAPEQMAAQPVSAASDVFSFCVSLYAGLYGEPPFAGATLSELRASILAGEVRPAPPGSDVPPWLRALALRGLHADPSRRPPLRALLAELERERAFQGLSRAQRLLQEAEALSRQAGAGEPQGAFVKVAMALLQDIVADGAEPLQPRATGSAPKRIPDGPRDEPGPDSEVLDRVQIAGQHAAFIFREISSFQTLAAHFLSREGAGALGPEGTLSFDADAFYPVVPFVRAAHRFAQEIGPRAMFDVGLASAHNALLPGGIHDLEAALRLLDVSYHLRFRLDGQPMFDQASGRVRGGMGRYLVRRAGERALEVTASGPWPCDFDRGVIAGYVQRLSRDAVITHDEAARCRKKGDGHCAHLVSWGIADAAAAPASGALARATLRAARDVDQFVFDPFGRYLAARSLFYACPDPQLFVSVFWGAPQPEDVTLLERCWSVLNRAESLSHGSLVDLRRVTAVEPQTYQAMADSLRRGRALFGAAVRAQAILRPPGMLGALVSGHFEMEPPPFPFRIFTAPAEALAWLGRSEPGLIAELDAIQRQLARPPA